MEPNIMPLYSSSPPPLDYDGESEEDEFGDFGGFSVLPCSPLTDSREQPCSPRQSTSATEHGIPPPSCEAPVEQSQPTSTVNSGRGRAQVDEEGRHCNGHTVRDHPSGTHTAFLVGEETGFADFSVFTEQAAHPWCCGLAPVGSTAPWDGGEGDRNPPDSSGGQVGDSGQEVMNSEPRPCCAHKAKEDICTKVKHCEKRDTALAHTSQDHHLPRKPAAAVDLSSDDSQYGEEDLDRPLESQREESRSPSLNFYSSPASESEEERRSVGGEEERETSTSPPSHTASLYESATEDLTLFCDVLTADSSSADFEQNVPCFEFEEEEPDWDYQAAQEEEEEQEFSRHAHPTEGGLNQSQQEPPHQESSPTSNQSEPDSDAGSGFADFQDSCFDHANYEDCIQSCEAAEPCPGLPPSDSFADFCSASTPGEGSWVGFRELRTGVEEKPWTQIRAQDVDAEEVRGVSERRGSQDSLSCRVQHLLHISFPDVLVSAPGYKEEDGVEEEEEVICLATLLQVQHLPDCGDEGEPCSHAERFQWGMWWHHHDLHRAVGLKFQWGGSYTNKTLLRCLGVDTTNNIFFVGVKKQPLVAPAFASSLGMLEPSRVRAVSSQEHTMAAWPLDRLDPSTDSVQGSRPPSQRECSSAGLSSSQDGVKNQTSIDMLQQQPPTEHPLSSTGCPTLNLDYFGTSEEAPGSSSGGRSNTPPPGVDRELYELTISKVEATLCNNHGEDTLNRLMSTAEKTSTSVCRVQLQKEDLSTEAGVVIAALPDLSFMTAKVLMFPSILTAKECCEATSE